MFTPIDYSLLFTKKLDVLKRAFSLSAEYLKSVGDEVLNYMDYGIQLGRRFRSLKPWFIIRYFGVEGLQSRIREHIRLAKMFVQLMEKSNDFELIVGQLFSGVAEFKRALKAYAIKRHFVYKPHKCTPEKV